MVFDRGYFSFVLLYALVWRGAHPVFRIRRSSAFDDFIDGDRDDAVVSAVAETGRVAQAPRRFPRETVRPGRPAAGPVHARGQRVRARDHPRRHRQNTRLDDLSGLYHGRWGIEELSRTSKAVIAVDEFHGRTERGARQELYAHFNLIAMTRLLSNRSDGLLEELREGGREKMTVNFKNGLAIMAANLEELVLMRVAALAETVTWMAERILAVAEPAATGAVASEENVEGRTLIAHASDDLKDRGFAASLAFDPDPATKRGPSLTLRQELGGQTTGGLDALFAPNPLDKRTGSEATSHQPLGGGSGLRLPGLRRALHREPACRPGACHGHARLQRRLAADPGGGERQRARPLLRPQGDAPRERGGGTRARRALRDRRPLVRPRVNAIC